MFTRSGHNYGDLSGFGEGYSSSHRPAHPYAPDPYARDQYAADPYVAYRPHPHTAHYQQRFPVAQVAPPTTVSSVDDASTTNTIVDSKIDDTAATLDTLQSMLSTMKPTSDFEQNIVQYLGLLTAQMKEIKFEQAHIIKRSVANARDNEHRFAHVNRSFDDVNRSVIKTEQYSRRDTITMSGLSKATEGETAVDLGNRIANTLSKCGVKVKPDDLSAFHRNSATGRTVPPRDGSGGTRELPPSITVRFKAINLKDEIIRSYKNYDSENSKQMDVKVYHSLTPHYSNLRRDIESFFKSGNSSANSNNPHSIQPGDKQLKWCKYQSPSSGLVLKLMSDEYMNGVHTWPDFCDKFHKVVVLGARY